MDRIFTKERFESAARSLSGYRMTFSHVLNESRNCANADSWQKTIFLSHSHYDAKYVNVARWRKRSIPTHSGWLYPLTFDAGKGLKEA